MTRFLSACAFLLATSAWAAESPAETPPAPAEPPVAASEPPSVPAPEAMPVPAQPPRPAPAPAEAVPVAPSEPPPYTGWGRGVRAPMYVNLMFFAGALGEDGDNRLTTRDSKLLEGVGGLFRIGAVLGPHHRLGGRMQSFVRPTKKVALDAGSTATSTDEWGTVTFGYVGPEYLYTSDLGIYGGASLGVGFAGSSRQIADTTSDDSRRHTEKASAGLAGMLSLGYEWRANKWFAMNVEAFGGLYHGVDDNENSMNGSLFGFGMGVGF